MRLSANSVRRLRTARSLLTAACALVAPACSTLTAVRPELRLGALDVSGDLGVSAAGGAIQAGSSWSALGLDDERYVEPVLDVDWDDWHVEARGLTIDYGGTGTAQAAINFGGGGISVSEPVATDVDLGLATASAVYDVLGTDAVDVGLGAGVGWLDYSLDVRSLQTSNSVATDNDLPFAFLTLHLSKDIDLFELRVAANGVVWSNDAEELSYYDVDARAGYRLFGYGANGVVSIGWRFLGIDYQYDDRGRRTFVDADFNGPFASFIVEF
jgi:hypothetical protein